MAVQRLLVTCPADSGPAWGLFQGEIVVDQAHRGYDVTVDETGKAWYNPF